MGWGGGGGALSFFLCNLIPLFNAFLTLNYNPVHSMLHIPATHTD